MFLVGGIEREGLGLTDNPPPPTHRGEPLANFFSPPPTHIGTQGGGVPPAKSPPHPGSLRGVGWEDAATGHGPPPWGIQKLYTPTLGGDPWQNFRGDPGTPTSPGANRSKSCRHTPHRRGGPLAKFSRGPGDTYIPGENPLENLTAYPPPPRRTQRDQVRASAHSGHQIGQAPPPLLPRTAQQRGEPDAGSLQDPPGIPHPGGGPWNIPPPTAVSSL